jgi:hypothetical protein
VLLEQLPRLIGIAKTTGTRRDATLLRFLASPESAFPTNAAKDGGEGSKRAGLTFAVAAAVVSV